MKTVLVILLTILMTSCNTTPRQKFQDSKKIDTINHKSISASGKYSIDHSLDTSIINNNLVFKISVRDISDDLATLSATYDQQVVLNDTISSHGIAYFKFPDFDNDGNSDILFDYIGNNSTYFLYLFDPVTNKFRNIKDYSKFPDAIQLKTNSQYYYSYHRAGCADMNWMSDLFMIDDFNIIHLGNIYGQGCDGDPKKVDIYKVRNNESNSKILFMTLPIDTIDKYTDYKWGFIKDFWTNNYLKFAK